MKQQHDPKQFIAWILKSWKKFSFPWAEHFICYSNGISNGPGRKRSCGKCGSHGHSQLAKMASKAYYNSNLFYPSISCIYYAVLVHRQKMVGDICTCTDQYLRIPVQVIRWCIINEVTFDCKVNGMPSDARTSILYRIYTCIAILLNMKPASGKIEICSYPCKKLNSMITQSW